MISNEKVKFDTNTKSWTVDPVINDAKKENNDLDLKQTHSPTPHLLRPPLSKLQYG